MSALNAGNNDRAATLVATYLTRHPRDSRSEDAAYLRVLAFQRVGDTSSMKQAAREYLQRFSNGFRRAEMEPLAR